MNKSEMEKQVIEEVKTKAKEQNLAKVSEVVITVGAMEAEEEEKRDFIMYIRHILKERMKVPNVNVIVADTILQCKTCGNIVDSSLGTLMCGMCNSMTIKIVDTVGIEVVRVR